MSNMVTRCPKCATSFRITSAQLQSAKGAVRCGSCLHIFKAQDHLISGAPTQSPAKAAPSPTAAAAKTTPSTKPAATAKPAASTQPGKEIPKPAAREPGSHQTAVKPTSQAAARPASQTAATTSAPPPAKPAEQKLAFSQEDINRELALSGDDDFLISDDMDEPDEPKRSDYEFDGFLDLEKLPKQSASLFDREIRQKEPEKDDIDPDESWAMELLDEADEDTRLSSIQKKNHESEDEGFSADERLSDTRTEDDSDNSSEPQHSSRSSAVPFKGPVFNIVAEKDEVPEEAEEIHAQPYNENQLYQQALADNHKDDSRLRAFDTSRAALLMNIMPEPVEMTTRYDRQRSAKRLWGGLSALLVLVLFIQIAWLQFDNLNRTEPYRSFYASVCSVLGCQLPALVDRSKIRAYNLVVRNHPKLENALIVDAILLNNASFQQPFPDLILAFSTIDDIPVASRRFKPQEYLRGELAGRSLMPQNQPVHLTLELVDPGSEAVNYHVYIPE
jgi:predicted Zn finger-like uncharacterized protein